MAIVIVKEYHCY